MSRDEFFPSGIFRMFDDIFSEFPFTPRVKVTYNCTNIPPVNLVLRKNRDLEFEFALAGYSDENIDVEFLGDYLTLRVKKVDKEIAEGDVNLFNGIKSSAIENRYFVPSDKYDTENVSAEWKNGLLKIKVPAKERAEARKIDIKKV